MSTSSIIDQLAQIVGAEHVATDDRIDRELYDVDGQLPFAVLSPASAEEISRVLSVCHTHGLAVIPFGGGSQMTVAETPARYDIALSLKRLSRIIAHEPADMTVTVEAGLSLADLQAHLRQANQVLPLDPPLPEEATVGGILATKASGPLRFAYRNISDHLLGIRVVNAQGIITKAGGRVVKNVSGYEMGRLYTGSYGTLAVIVEATFKVRPRFDVGAVLTFVPKGYKEAGDIIQCLMQSETEPTLLEWIGPQPMTIIAGFTGTQEEVAWLVNKAKRHVSHEMGLSQNGPSSEPEKLPWSALYPVLLRAHREDASPKLFPGVINDGDFCDAKPHPQASTNGASPHRDIITAGKAAVTCRVATPISQMSLYLQEAENIAHDRDIRFTFAVHAGNGVARLHVRETTPSRSVPLVQAWRESVHTFGGYLVIEKAPLPIRQALSTFGEPGQDFFLHRAIKQKMDPEGILNPGRFIGRL